MNSLTVSGTRLRALRLARWLGYFVGLRPYPCGCWIGESLGRVVCWDHPL